MTVFAVFARVLPRRAALFALVSLGLAAAASAQVAPTGVITGRIVNTDTGEYVRNAEVRVVETGTSVVSEDGGFYRLANVPAGEVRLAVSYPGYAPVTAMVTVGGGIEATQDFEFSSVARTRGDEPIKLDTFVVQSQIVGESKALAQQRNSQDITNVVSSEQFGDVVGGNIAEFLKNVPGIELDLDRGEATSVRLRGLPSQYTSVTLDGMSMASADANGAVAPNTRALNFQAFSLDSLESIEISKTVSADVDANAPAGTINLRPKRAFDLVGRRVVLETHLTAHSDHLYLGKSYGPDEGQSGKVLPGGSIQYSDVLLNKRLGFNLTTSVHKQFSEHQETRHTYNYATTATDTRPIVPTLIGFYNTPRTDYRDTISFTTDFKATPNLVLSLGLLYNTAELRTWQRESIFTLGARNTILGADPLTGFTTSATNASINSNPTAILKRNQTISATPKFEYRKGNLRVEGRFMFGEAKSWYDPWGRGGAVRDFLGGSTPINSGVTFRGERDSVDEGFHITQTGGLDWSDGSSFTTGSVRITDGRGARTFNYTADVSATLSTFKGVPIVWKAGVKRAYQWRKYWNDTALGVYSLNGAPARGGWAAYPSPMVFETGPAGNNFGASVTSVSGGPIWMGHLEGIGALLRDNPERFTHTISAANWYTANVNERRELEETIDAAFLMATATLGKNGTLRAGYRWEDTTTDVLEFDPLTRAEMTAAGFATDAATSRATTIPGLEYQYLTNPKIHRKGNYDNFFPSASFKYRFPKDIDFQLGFSSTIRRPTFGNLTGAWVVNDTSRTVAAPNKDLRPEESRNFSLRLAKYFKSQGVLAVNFYQNNVRGLHVTQSGLTAEEFGWEPSQGGPDLSTYLFTTTTQGTDVTTLRGMEIEYSQALRFLPKPFDGFSVRGSYTRNYADGETTLLAPHAATGGLTYARRKWNVYANYKWTDDNVQSLATVRRSYKAEGKLDIGGTYRFTPRWSVYFYARNITDAHRIVIERNTANPDAPWTTNMIFNDGTNWTFGGRYTF
jgi:iron complex outermembrane receptor protein